MALVWAASTAVAVVDRQPDEGFLGRAAPTLGARDVERPTTHVPGEVVVRFRSGVAQAGRTAAMGSGGVRAGRALRLSRAHLVRTTAGTTVKEAVAALEADPRVEFAQPNYIKRALLTPNDARMGDLWGLHNTGQTVAGVVGTPDADIDAPEAWDISTGNSSVSIAVLDSGIALNHPDIAPNLWTNPGEIAGNGIDDDGNGYVDDINGWDFLDNDSDPTDPKPGMALTASHGTHVASTAAGRGQNATGVAGVAHTAKIMALRFLDDQGGTTVDEIEGIHYAAANGARVVNMSFGYRGAPDLAEKAAIDAHPNVLFVAAAGNDNLSNETATNASYPCSYTSPNIICVAATTQSDARANFSAFGPTSVDLGAPGTNVLGAQTKLDTTVLDNFDANNFATKWTVGGTLPDWARTTTIFASGTGGMFDGSPGNYANMTNSWAMLTSPLDLTGRRGCSVAYDLRLNTEFNFDWFVVRTSLDGAVWDVEGGWTGDSNGQFIPLGTGITRRDGQSGVRLLVQLWSDELVTGDGAYLDNLVLNCIAAGPYTGSADEFALLNGTSMATPHVTGAAALLLSVKPSLTPVHVKRLLMRNVDAKAAMQGATVSGGRLNINRAVRAPMTADDELTTLSGSAGSVNVLANDTDADTTAIAVSQNTNGANGTVSCAPAGTCTYTPNPGFAGADSFTYTASDGQNTDTGTVSVTVNSFVNTPPVATDDTLTTAEDTAGGVNVLGNDNDANGHGLSVTGATNGASGTASCTPAGVCTYTPNANYFGVDSFTYTVSDGFGGTDTGAVNVTVTAVNDAPVAQADALTVVEDGSGQVNVLSNDSDVEAGSLTVTESTNGSKGTASCTAAGVCTYTPNANAFGSDSFTYTVSDGQGGTAVGTVNVTITAVNDPPVAAANSLTTAEDTAGTVSVLGNDTDVDGDTLSLTANTNGANGTVSCTPSGACTYTPATNFNGADSFTYTVSDGQGGTDTATVNVTVTSVNDAPVAHDNALTVAEDGSGQVAVLSNDSDPDGGSLAVSANTDAAHGAVTCTAAGTCTYTPVANFHGLDSFTYTVGDGQGGSATASVAVTVTAVNDPPVAGANSLTVAEDGSGEVGVLGNDTDIDGGALSVTAFGAATHGSVACSGAGLCSYTPDADWFGPDTFTYTVGDGKGGTDVAVVSVTVTPVNDAPVAGNDSLSVPYDTAASIDVLENDSDIDGTDFTVTARTDSTKGAVTCIAAGVCTYTPTAGSSGADSFTYMVADSAGGFDIGTVRVAIGGAPPAVPVAPADAPVAGGPAGPGPALALGEPSVELAGDGPTARACGQLAGAAKAACLRLEKRVASCAAITSRAKRATCIRKARALARCDVLKGAKKTTCAAKANRLK